MATTEQVLVIETCEINRNLLQEILGNQSYKVTIAASCLAAMHAIEHSSYNLILMSQCLFEYKHDAERDHLLELAHSIPVLLLCTTQPDATALRHFNSNLSYYLHKPYDQSTLLDSISWTLSTATFDPSVAQFSGANTVSKTSASAPERPLNDSGLIKTR